MVSGLAASAVDRWFEPYHGAWSGKSKDYTIGISCFSARQPTLRSKSKDWLAQNQDNMSVECCFCDQGSVCLSSKKWTSSPHQM